MILTSNPFDTADYSERSLVSRILVAFLFNRSARCNSPDGQAFRRFLKMASGQDVSPESLSRCWATTEFCVKRATDFPDQTELDALAGSDDILTVIECKYCDFLKVDSDQLSRVRNAASALGKAGNFRTAGMTVIAPEEEFASIASQPHRSEIRSEIRGILAEPDTPLTFISWGMVFDIIASSSSMDGEMLSQYVSIRNAGTPYPIKLTTRPKVRTPEEWRFILLGQKDVPEDLVPPSRWGASSRSPHETATEDGLFEPYPSEIREIHDFLLATLRTATSNNVQTFGRRDGRYVNVQPKKGKNYFLSYPTADGLAVIIDKQYSTQADTIAFENWPESSRLKKVHSWFRKNADDLRVLLMDTATWSLSGGKQEIEAFVRELLGNRDR